MEAPSTVQTEARIGFDRPLFIAVVLNYRLKAINLFRTAYYVPSILGGSIAIAVLWLGHAVFSRLSEQFADVM